MTTSMMMTVLIVDDEEAMRDIGSRMVASLGHRAETARDGEEALRRVREEGFDLVLADLRMPRKDGMDLLREIKEFDPRIEVIMVSGFGTIESAVEAIKLGASDYVTKPLQAAELKKKLERTLKNRQLSMENRYLKSLLKSKNGSRCLIGTSQGMQTVFSLIAKVAGNGSTVLVEGESGTGKELVARAIHDTGPRSSGPFIPVHCAAMTQTVIESELFGHRKGAFTNAFSSKEGLFKVANGGTLFLDEVSEIPPETQVKLLRVLQEKEIRPVGDTRTIRIDVRVIAATNRNLDKAVQDGQFREDLFYRLNVVPILVPPLRDRPDDIPVLVDHFLRERNSDRKRFSGLSKKAMKIFLAYPWPGNIRELENCIELFFALGSGGTIDVEDLPPHLFQKVRTPLQMTWDKAPNLKELERAAIEMALRENQNDVLAAAHQLQVGKSTLYRKIKEYKLR
ncbi:MAG: sigma-54 dependent transcriptional regulator [Planctomycetota bacterium]|nr:sigma-54 dependent transcriptional regulator [Planctomycetota bacterium]